LGDSPGSYLAIDIGGTKIAAGVVDATGALSARQSVQTPLDGGAAGLLDGVVALATSARTLAGTDVLACGVGCGGPMEGDTVSPLNIPVWRHFPLAASLADALGLAVAVDNDAKALALAEGWLGAARSHRSFLAMVVSTGVGGGIVLDNRLLDGRLGNAGHIGHVIVEPDGRRCPCGARGCLEAEASGNAIEVVTGEPASEAPHDVRVRTGTLVGRAVASVASLLDLDLAVVGGSVALGFGAPFFEAAQAELSKRARLEFSKDCRIVPVGLGDEAPLVGAAAVAMRHDRATWITP
jgi:glucokinase